MDNLYILKMANTELLRKWDAEVERQKANPDSEISKNLIARYENEMSELGQMIINAESVA